MDISSSIFSILTENSVRAGLWMSSHPGHKWLPTELSALVGSPMGHPTMQGGSIAQWHKVFSKGCSPMKNATSCPMERATVMPFTLLPPDILMTYRPS